MNKLENILSNKKIYILGIIIIVVSVLLLVLKIIIFLKSNNNQDSISENLYHIVYSNHVDSDLELYDFFITKDYDVIGRKKTISNEELKKYNKQSANGKKEYYLEDVLDKLIKENHNKIFSLTNNQKNLLKETFGKTIFTETTKELKSVEIDNNMYFIVDYKNNKALISKENSENYNLEIILSSFINANTKYLDYFMRDNEVTNYIKDTNYKELDVNSDIVKNLYSKVNYNNTILDSYIEEKITNDTIITLTLELMSSNKEFENCSDEDELSTSCNFDMNKFDYYAKSLFGPNVQYNLNNYKNVGNSCYSYGYNKEKLYFKSGSGCGMEEGILNNIRYAYQTEEKIVIIEDSLFLTYGSCNESSPCYSENLGYLPGVYNNIKEGLLIKNLNEGDNFTLQSKYSQFFTYYSYTFVKGEDGKYYFTNFERLN